MFIVFMQFFYSPNITNNNIFIKERIMNRFLIGPLPGEDGEMNKKTTKQEIRFRYIVMDFFNSAVDCLETLVCALGAGLGIWGAINLLEGYGNDNRATRL